MKIIEIPLILVRLAELPRVAGCCSLGRSGRSSRGAGIGPRGRRRRPRVPKHVRNVASVVPTNFYGDWRSLNRFLEFDQKDTILLKKTVFFNVSFVTALTWRECEKVVPAPNYFVQKKLIKQPDSAEKSKKSRGAEQNVLK